MLALSRAHSMMREWPVFDCQVQPLPGGGDRTCHLASRAPQREHLKRVWTDENAFVPNSLAASKPSTVRALSQLPHSIRGPAPKRTRSAAVRMCFVDIAEH